MYWKKKGKINIEKLNSEHNIRIKEIEASHKIELKEKEFELAHFKDEAVKAGNLENLNLKLKIVVLEKENEMLGKITNLNADIIDIKDLVRNLIGKLPEIKLTNLTIANDTKK